MSENTPTTMDPMEFRFNAASEIVLAEPDIPPGEKKAYRSEYWAGAPCATVKDDLIALTYRLRCPREAKDEEGNDIERGWSNVLMASRDGFHFEELGRFDKHLFQGASVEKCAPLFLADGSFAIYVSYASIRNDETKGMWCIDRIRAESMDALVAGDCESERVLVPHMCPGLDESCSVTGVKDPFFLTDKDGNLFFDGMYHMIVSFSKAPADLESPIHHEADCYNSGKILSSTAYLTSEDGVEFTWHGEILAPEPITWYAYASRITSLLKTDEGWIGTFDGGRSVAENYNERAGLTMGEDLHSLRIMDPNFPSLSPLYQDDQPAGGEGGVRYISSVKHMNRILFFYEYTRYDGSHDLRVAEARIVPRVRPTVEVREEPPRPVEAPQPMEEAEEIPAETPQEESAEPEPQAVEEPVEVPTEETSLDHPEPSDPS